MSTLSIPALPPSQALRDQVYATLERLIINGDLAPEQRLAEAELAERLGVSRNPVREALTVLAHAGWVDIRPRIGAEVHAPTRKEMEDFLAVRTVIKQEAARMAAGHSTPGGIAELRDLVLRGQTAAARGDVQTASELNSVFHTRVDANTDNLVLQEVLSSMKKRLTWYFAPVARSRGVATWQELAVLVDALERRDVDAAAIAMRDHCEATAKVCRELIRERHGVEGA